MGVEVVGLVVCLLDEHGDAAVRVSLRDDSNTNSSVCLVPILRDVVPVRCVCVKHWSGVGDPPVDSSVCDVGYPNDQEEGVGRHQSISGKTETESGWC